MSTLLRMSSEHLVLRFGRTERTGSMTGFTLSQNSHDVFSYLPVRFCRYESPSVDLCSAVGELLTCSFVPLEGDTLN